MDLKQLRRLCGEIQALACYDYSGSALEALAEVLRGADAEGRCPVKL